MLIRPLHRLYQAAIDDPVRAGDFLVHKTGDGFVFATRAAIQFERIRS